MRRTALPLLAVALASLAGCSSNFLPPSYLNDLRVLAILATPLELIDDGMKPPSSIAIDLHPVVYPAGSVTSQTWSFCPLSAGSIAGYACAVKECEGGNAQGQVPSMVPGADGSIHVTLGDLLTYCYAGASLPDNIPSPVETLFRYTVSSTTSPGTAQSRVAVLGVPLWVGPLPAGFAPNAPPRFQTVEIGGKFVYAIDPSVKIETPPPLPIGGSLPVHVVLTPDSAQTYVDAAGVTQVEILTIYFYATAGRFASDLATGLDTAVALQGNSFTAAELARPTLSVYVVALDLRGGQAVAGPFAVPTPSP